MKWETKLKIKMYFKYGLLTDFAFLKRQYLTYIVGVIFEKAKSKNIFLSIKSVSEYTLRNLENYLKNRNNKIAHFWKRFIFLFALSQ